MKQFEHHDALSIEEAVALLSDYEGKAKIIAGGTDLLGALRDEVFLEYPEALINIKTIDGLDYIRSDEKGLAIGAMAGLADIVKSPVVKKEYQMLAEAAYSVATPQIRNMATIGGNLAQDVRCWFYRYPRRIGGPMVCLRKGGKFCSALAGDNRYHSIFGAAALSDISLDLGKVRKGCFAVGPSDIAVALIAMDASIVTTKRSLPAELFFKATALSSTVLDSDELVKEIEIPKLPMGAVQRYDKFTLRKPIDFAVVSVASMLTLNNGVCEDARIVLGAVAPEPVRARKAEQVMKGRIVDEDVALEAAEHALAGSSPLRMNEYKVEIAKVLVKHAIWG
ncbi:MAG: FAD binding domain-containing protein [Desulfomonile tiedjei]|uniref:FAD binding domain-containing protein n=1 Tax=Desulfomonile tiedjei TaxID=2358 RepID=A0A9D6V5L2_9BACT|nr:FAD binding domain-containing protein [Desulfomonile tiedjei]